jgi:nitroreductase
LVLEGHEQTRRFWELDADPEWLARPTHPGVLRAPVIVVPLTSRRAYLDRYQEPDKGRPDLAWSAPYWWIDGAFATMLLLLGVVDEGLGALFFALHGDPAGLLEAHGVPSGWEPLGAVALGWPDPEDRPVGSAVSRPRRRLDEIVHRGRWSPPTPAGSG